jgi:hypothetical protein
MKENKKDNFRFSFLIFSNLIFSPLKFKLKLKLQISRHTKVATGSD